MSSAQAFLRPQEYIVGQRGDYFGLRRFGEWTLLAIWHGSISFWLPLLAFPEQGLWFGSMVSFMVVIHIVAYKLFLESVFITWANLAVGGLSVAVFYLAFALLSIDMVASVL